MPGGMVRMGMGDKAHLPLAPGVEPQIQVGEVDAPVKDDVQNITVSSRSEYITAVVG